MALAFISVLSIASCNLIPTKQVEEKISKDSCGTVLIIHNSSSQDSVLTYLTLGADTNFITNVKGIFGIADSGLQGSFYMRKDSTYTYKYDKKGLSGNICFGTTPINCPDSIWKTGVNLFEFTINNEGTITDAQETIDISNVAGENALGKFLMKGGNSWIADGTPVDSFYNNKLYSNLGQIGVYPFKCDACTGSVNPPVCTDTLKAEQPQVKPTCNVSRKAVNPSGNVTINFMGWSK